MIERGDRYSGVAIAFHWTIAALILFNLWLGLFHDALPREWRVMTVHRAVGIAVLALSLGRLAWRLAHKPPHLPDNMRPWEKLGAKALHWTLYGLMIGLPLTGWLLSSNPQRPRPISFGLFEVPVLPISQALSQAGRAVHGPLGYLLTALLVLHIGAALRHHLILKDRVLVRMLPLFRRN